MQGAKIIGISKALPKKIVTNDDLSKLFDTNDEWITQRTGIKERRVLDPSTGESGLSLGTQAALGAIEFANKHGNKIEASEIDLIICATATGDYLFPASACMIQSNIGAENAVGFDISAACSGYVFALNTAYNYIRSGQYKNVLVVAIDIMSRFVDWSDRRTAIIFGDGTGATLISACPKEEDAFKSFYIASRGDTECSLTLDNQGLSYPQSKAESKQETATVYMDGQAVYQFAVKAVPEAIQKACEKAGIEANELDFLVPHQANQRIMDSASKRLGIDKSKVISNISKYGNTSAASIPIAFTEAIEEGIINPPGGSQKIAMVGFGAGLTWGACVVEF